MASSGFRPNPHAEIRANSENCVRICDTHSIREISSSRNRTTKSFESDGFHANRSTQKLRRDLKVTFWSQKSRFNSARSQINVSISAGYWCYFTQSNALEYQLRFRALKRNPMIRFRPVWLHTMANFALKDRNRDVTLSDSGHSF